MGSTGFVGVNICGIAPLEKMMVQQYPQNVEVVSLVLISKFYFQTFSTCGLLVDVGLIKFC